MRRHSATWSISSSLPLRRLQPVALAALVPRAGRLRARIRAMRPDAAESGALLNAIVHETLRLNQSESLLRLTRATSCSTAS
jgi:hypothetical protein